MEDKPPKVAAHFTPHCQLIKERRYVMLVAWRLLGRRLRSFGEQRPPDPTLRREELSQNEIPSIFQMIPFGSLDFYEITVQELQQHFSSGRLTSVEYINPYLEAIIEVNPDAIDLAAQLDQERRHGNTRGMLHGIPVLVKDNMATKDKMQTTAGSWALLGSVVPKDAHVVLLLRQAGAIIIGHANMSEWSSVRSKASSTGYSPRGGQTRNPYNLSSSPHTSIIGPASMNGVVGIKPTVGLTSRSGVIPISKNMDTVGPFGRTVADAVLGLSFIVGRDLDDASTSLSKGIQGYYTQCLSSRSALQGARFGLPQKRCWNLVSKDRKKVALRVLKAIEEAGGVVIDTDFPCVEDRIPENGSWDWEYGKASESEFTVVKVDAYNGINKYLSNLSATEIRSVEDIIDFNNRNRGTEGAQAGDHPAFPSGQDNLQDIAQTKGVEDSTYQDALGYIHRKTREEGIDAALRRTTEDGESIELDALLLFDRKGAGQQLAAQAGYPIICIPIGLDSAGMPFSLSLQHTAWKEETLIKWASAIEDLVNGLFGWRPTPTYREYKSKNIPINREATG
ncbi:MAG: hypothetical protein Q9163_005385 [Psora crenata]